jgi:hypothetical protein
MPIDEHNYLRNYVRLNQGTEVPNLFAIWCGIAGISCALGRRVWIDMGQYHIFPNFYIVLVAGSGRLRKSTAIGVVERILRSVQPPFNLIAQKITPEGLIDAIKTTETQDATRLLAEKSEGFVIADELATFLNRNSYEAGLASLLIPFFDCKESFSYRTMGRGEQKISNACLGILAASTVEWITNAIPATAVGGGLTSRVIFVYVEEPTAPIARTTYTQEKYELVEWLVKATSRMASYTGEAKLTPEAWEFYDKEYYDWVGHPGDSSQGITPRRGKGFDMAEDPNLSGYFSRRNMHLLKLGIILAVADRPMKDGVVTVEERDLVGARRLLENSEVNMPMVLSLITTSEQGQLTALARTIIRKGGANGISRPELLRAMSNKIGSRELDMLLDTLEHSSLIRKVITGSTMRYFETKPT